MVSVVKFCHFFPCCYSSLCLYVSECASMTDRSVSSNLLLQLQKCRKSPIWEIFLNQENLGFLANEGSNYMKDEQTGGDNICCCIGVIKRTRNMQLAQQVLQTSLLGLHFVRQGIYLFIYLFYLSHGLKLYRIQCLQNSKATIQT